MGLFDDIGSIFNIIWIIILAFIAYWLYNWARETLVFSSTLAYVVAGILIYYLVFEYPIVGVLGVTGWIIITSGVLMGLAIFAPVFGNILYKMKKGDAQ